MAEPSVATTGIDSLVRYLKDHGESDSISLAIALKVDQTVVEEWVKVLEKADIVKISYRLGRMYISALIAKPENVQTIKEGIEVRKGALESDVNAQAVMMEQISKRVGEMGRIVSGGEEAFKKKSPTLKKYLDELKKLQKETESKFKAIESADARINMLAKNMDKKLKALQEHAVNIEKISTGAADAERIIEDMKNKTALAKSDIDGLMKRFNDIVDGQRKELNSLIGGMRAEMKAVSENIEGQEAQIREGNRSGMEYKREVEDTRKRLEKDSTHMLDETSKSRDEIDAYYKLAKDKFDGFNRELEAVSRSFGDLSQFDKRLSGIQDQLNEASSEREKLAKEIQGIDMELKAISGITEQNVAGSSVKIDDASRKVSEASSKINALGGKVSDIKKGVDDIAEGR